MSVSPIRLRAALAFKPRRGRPFSMMRNAALMEMSADKSMTACAWATLSLLTGIADRHGVAEATLDEIIAHTGYDRAGTSRTITKLIDAGRLERVQDTTGRVRRSAYRIPRRVCIPQDVRSR
jgi:DNA-binding MarR family transcriptional regulator